MSITIIADDLTGANDTAVAFAERGLRAATALRAERIDMLRELGYDVVAYSTESRPLSPNMAGEAVLRSAIGVGAHPGQTIYKKIDSALRGPIAAELDALLQAVPWARYVLVAPAFPSTGRTTVGGEQRIYGRPVHLTEMAHDPLTPVRTSHVPTLLREGSPHGVYPLPLECVDKGVDAIVAELAGIPAGVRYVVADAACDSHLDALAELILRDGSILPCGSAGLAAALGRRLGAYNRPDAVAVDPGEGGAVCAGPGGLLMVVGSRSPRAQEQLKAVRESAPWVQHVVLRVECLVRPAGDPQGALEREFKRAAEQVAAAITSGGAAVLYPVGEAQGVAPSRITKTLAAIARTAAAPSAVGSFFLTGGETAAHVLAGLGASALEIRAEYAPGVCVGRIIDGTERGATVITKAGSFGSEGLLVELADAWRASCTRPF